MAGASDCLHSSEDCIQFQIKKDGGRERWSKTQEYFSTLPLDMDTSESSSVYTSDKLNFSWAEEREVKWGKKKHTAWGHCSATERNYLTCAFGSVRFCSVLTVPFQISWQFHVLFWSMSQALDFLSQITRFLTLLVLLLKSRAVSYLQTLRTNVICTAFAQWWCVYVCEDDVITIGLHRDFYMWNRCFPSAILTVNTLTSC